MIKNVDSMVISKIAKGNWFFIIPFILGLLMYTRFIPHYEYLSRIPISIVVSAGLGLAARASLETNVFVNLWSVAKLSIIGVESIIAFNNIVLFIGLFTVVFYFFFTLNPKIVKRLNVLSVLGRYFLMIYFGTRFGATVMTRMTLFMGRIQFLLFEWLKL